MFIMNTEVIKSDTSNFSCSIVRDPYRMQHLACLHNFDTSEIPDGYSLKDVDEMIEFLTRVQQKLRFKNTEMMTAPLFSDTVE